MPGAGLALREDFLDSLNFRRQGQVLLLAGDFQQSIPLFLKALELDPQNHEARLRLAVAYTQADEQQKAEAEFETLLDRLAGDKKHADLLHDVHCYMALLSRRQYDPDRAVEHYRAALRCKPDDITARLMLGLVLASQREFAEAEQTLSDAVRIDQSNALAHMWLGLVISDAGRAEDGRASLLKALSLSPGDRDDWELIAQRLLPRTDVAADLVAFLGRYGKQFPDDARPHVLTAKVHINAGRNALAIDELSKALEKNASLSWIPAKIQELKKDTSGAETGNMPVPRVK